jgi:hypothetical protein
LDEHGEELEADLQRWYRVDVRDLWTGILSWRRLGVLVKNLPAESATKTALRNAAPLQQVRESATAADYGPWSQTDMLLAELIDVARWLQWSKTKAAEKNTDHPEPFPRPGVQRKGAAPVNATVVSMLEYLRTHNGAAPGGYTAKRTDRT